MTMQLVFETPCRRPRAAPVILRAPATARLPDIVSCPHTDAGAQRALAALTGARRPTMSRGVVDDVLFALAVLVPFAALCAPLPLALAHIG